MSGKNRLLIDPVNPDPGAILRAAAVIRAGGVVVYPTRFLYGLGVDAMRPEAVARVFSLKRRRATNPVSVLIHRETDLELLVAQVPDAARIIMDRLWPGYVTLVFFASAHLPENLTAKTGKIGIRLPLHPGAKKLVEAVAFPITATSANLSGGPGCAAIEEMAGSLLREADLVLDAGRLSGGAGSTVVDVTVYPPKILREGAVSAADVLAGMDG